MDARAKTVSEILHAGDQYLIPFFQRQYSWTHKHWERLRDDIWALVDDGATNQHFLGPLVCTPTEHVPGEVTPYQLIDGQQRLTTLTLLLSAIRDTAKEHGLAALAEEVTENFLIHKYRKGLQRYKVVPRAVDRDALMAIVEGQVKPEHERFGVCQAWHFFGRHVEELAGGDTERNLRGLFDAIASRLSLVVITITGENPYEIFESLNSTGLPLAESDLIRNYIFMQVPQPEQDEFQAKHWQPFEAVFGEANEERAKSQTLFYRSYLMRDGVYSRNKATFVDFKEKNRERKLSPADQVSELIQFAEYESQLRRPQSCEDADLGKALTRIDMLEITTAHPLLLNLMDRHRQGQLSKQNLLGCMDDLGSFVLRRSICGESTRTYGQWFTEAITVIATNPRDDLRGYWLKRGWPDDKTFTARLLDFAMYRREGKKCRLILDALEESYKHKERVDPTTLTIEHVMPQTLKKGRAAEGWRKMLGEHWEDVHRRLLHTLGNVTLTGYNPDLGNQPFAEKKLDYAKSNLVLNWYFADVAAWDEAAILDRGQKLAAEVAGLWSRPAGGPIYVPPQTVSVRQMSAEMRVQYWKALLDKADLSFFHKLPEPSTQGWLRFSIKRPGVRLLAFMQASQERIGVAAACRGIEGKPFFELFRQQKDAIEAITGELKWEDHARGQHYISLTRAADVTDEASWSDQHTWLTSELKAFREAFTKVIAELVAKGVVSAVTPPVPSKVASAVVTELLTQSSDFEILRQLGSSVWFLPSSWSAVIPNNGTAWKHLSRPVGIACWFEFTKHRIKLIFEACRMTDPAVRLACMKKLKAAGFTLTKRAFQPDVKYSRFFRMSARVDMNDPEAIREAATAMLEKAMPLVPQAEKVFKDVFGHPSA